MKKAYVKPEVDLYNFKVEAIATTLSELDNNGEWNPAWGEQEGNQ